MRNVAILLLEVLICVDQTAIGKSDLFTYLMPEATWVQAQKTCERHAGFLASQENISIFMKDVKNCDVPSEIWSDDIIVITPYYSYQGLNGTTKFDDYSNIIPQCFMQCGSIRELQVSTSGCECDISSGTQDQVGITFFPRNVSADAIESVRMYTCRYILNKGQVLSEDIPTEELERMKTNITTLCSSGDSLHILNSCLSWIEASKACAVEGWKLLTSIEDGDCNRPPLYNQRHQQLFWSDTRSYEGHYLFRELNVPAVHISDKIPYLQCGIVKLREDNDLYYQAFCNKIDVKKMSFCMTEKKIDEVCTIHAPKKSNSPPEEHIDLLCIVLLIAFLLVLIIIIILIIISVFICRKKRCSMEKSSMQNSATELEGDVTAGGTGGHSCELKRCVVTPSSDGLVEYWNMTEKSSEKKEAEETDSFLSDSSEYNQNFPNLVRYESNSVIYTTEEPLAENKDAYEVMQDVNCRRI